MALLQASTIEDYFSSSPLKKRKYPSNENNDQSKADNPSSTATASSDTITDTDINNDSTNNKWKPRVEYEDVLISELKPGFRGVRFMVRVVNVFEVAMKGGKGGCGNGNGARGCLKVLGRDGGGVVMIHLYFADVPYDIGLGTLLTVWTNHVSRVRGEEGGGTGTTPVPAAAATSGAELLTSIFPERDGKCHVKIHREERDQGLCRVSLVEGGEVESLVGVMQGRGNGNGRLLVYVKALGEVVSYTNTKGTPTQKIDVGIEDESGEAILTLFGRMMFSALKDWDPSNTILLITKPNCWPGSSKLTVSARTMIEVDPLGLGEEVEWLRRLAGWSGAGVNERFPEGVFDVQAAEEAITRVKFTLADIDDFIRVGPKNQIYMGYLSVLLTEVNLVAMSRANRLFSAECCRVPLYSNTSASRCGQCGENIELRLNPQIIGAITDETGTISPHPSSSPHLSSQKPTPSISNSKKNRTPLLWSPEAWRQLLGVRELGEVGRWRIQELQGLEERLRFLRVTVLFGWEEVRCGGRLAVCRVMR